MKKALLVAAILAVSGFVFWHYKSVASTNAQETAGDVASNSLPDSLEHAPALEAELSQADRLARAWQSDAELLAVAVEFKGELDLSALVYDYYVYGSSKVSDFGVINTKAKPLRLQTAKELALPMDSNYEPIPRSFWQVNYLDAIKLTEAAGGAAYRAGNDAATVSAVLTKTAGGVLVWDIAYKDMLGSIQKRWLVNAASGDLEEIRQ